MGTIIMQVHRALVIKGEKGWPNNNWISLLSIKNLSLWYYITYVNMYYKLF